MYDLAVRTTYNVQCTVQRTTYKRTMYNVQRTTYKPTMYNVQCTVYNVQRTNVQRTMYNVQRTLYIVRFVRCTLYNVHRTAEEIEYSTLSEIVNRLCGKLNVDLIINQPILYSQSSCCIRCFVVQTVCRYAERTYYLC